LGDELCSGTEHDSAVSIFVSGLEMLLREKYECCFRNSFTRNSSFREIEIWKAASRIALVVNDWINRISVLEIKDKLLDFKIVAWQTFDDLWIQIQSQKK